MQATLINVIAYLPFVQNSNVATSYFKIPTRLDAYLKNSAFLADINNENEVNADYVTAIEALEKFVMVMWSRDTRVFPKTSGFWETFQANSFTDLEAFTDSRQYTENLLAKN